MKLPLMVLLSIKTKSYRRLHCTHYKQVILKDSQVLGSQVRLLAGLAQGQVEGNSKSEYDYRLLCYTTGVSPSP